MRSEDSIGARCKCLLGILALSLLMVGCSKDPALIYPKPYNPPEPDLPDMGAEQEMGERTDLPRCDGLDGESCALPAATGACISGRCLLLACAVGAADCDDDPSNGCEQDVTLETSCGTCERACRDAESCQLGTRGYLCSAGIVCEQGRFDLDQDPENGCEWSIEGAEPFDLQPVFSLVTIDRAVVADETQAAIGTDAEGETVLVTSRDAEDALLGVAIPAPEGRDPEASRALPLHAAFDPEQGSDLSLLVAWEDGLSHHVIADDSDRIDRFFTHMCAPAEGQEPQSIKGFTWLERSTLQALAMLDSNIVPITRCEEGELCFSSSRAFGPADYTRMFYPYADRAQLSSPGVISDARWSFSEDEVSLCEPCVLDTARGAFTQLAPCWGASQCREDGFDAQASCGECVDATSGCPDFSPVSLAYQQDTKRVFAVTRRGVVILEDDGVLWRPVARLEDPFEAGVVSGRQFVRATFARLDEETTRLFLLHNSGFIRALDVYDEGGSVSVEPAAPDIGFEVELGARGVLGFEAIDANTLVMTGATEAIVIRLRALSARSETIELDTDGGADGYFGVNALDAGASLWRIRAGNFESVPVVELGSE